jgi:hypothetical protein
MFCFELVVILLMSSDFLFYFLKNCQLSISWLYLLYSV